MAETPKRAAIFSSYTHIQECKEYATREGYEIVAEFQEVASNSSIDRQVIQAILTAAEQGTFDALLIPRLSQLSHESEKVAKIIISLEERGIRCISITQNILMGGEAGTFTNMVAAIRTKVAEIERERLAIRRRAGRQRRGI